MTTLADAQPTAPVVHDNSRLKLAIVVVLAAAGDWLFYRRPVGISLVAFLLLLDAGALAANRVHAPARGIVIAAAVLIAALLPAIIEPGPLAVVFAVLGAAYFAFAAMAAADATFTEKVAGALRLIFDGCWRALYDVVHATNDLPKAGGWAGYTRPLIAWVMPAVLGALFLILFASANPLIEGWLNAIELKWLLAHVSVPRVMFWLLIVALAWPFIFKRRDDPLHDTLRPIAASELRETRAELSRVQPPSQLFGKDAILRSLIVFNALFALQTGLDIAYLWGGVALPDGMSYASYAHRGAYPLIVTALLAAAFVIAATWPGSEAERSPVIRALVFVWVAQNVLLVVSSILRLDLYVEVYSLTRWRVAAFVWMLLVAMGLVLIVARVALGRSNRWLVGANLVTLTLTLYVCAFPNWPHIIASYNVAHSQEVSGKGVLLDVIYLRRLGPQVIPALDRYLAQRGAGSAPGVQRTRDTLAATHLTMQTDWRAWSYRRGRLTQYLRAAAVTVNP